MEKESFELIVKIVERAEHLGIMNKKNRITSIMDIENAYKYFNIDLRRWLTSSTVNFAHDIQGIEANIDRRTNPVQFGFFVPRFAE